MSELENIHYNLKCLGGFFESDEIQDLIAKTIFRLPKEFWEKVPDEVIFICVDDNKYGQYISYSPIDNHPLHFIVLNVSIIETEEEKMYVIAHEIAHFVLHHSSVHTVNPPTKDVEMEADDLCERWGFSVPERRKKGKIG